MQINPAQLHPVKPLNPGPRTEAEQLDGARELQKSYRDFVGKTFYGQMLKSMRSTVGKAPYFDGGYAENVFRSQLDQVLADDMTEKSASKLADPMFRVQFPRQAEMIAKADAKASLMDLEGLRRR